MKDRIEKFDLSNKRILVTGAQGFVGRSLVPRLKLAGGEVIGVTRVDYDLLEQADVRRMFAETRPDVVFHLAGLIGGILANKTYPADYNYQNLLMGTMMLHEASRAGVRKYVSLMGGCSYPAKAPSPIKEAELWNGYPQAESAPYSLAKAMSVVQAQAYRNQYGFNAIILVPGNLYGPHDNFDLQNSHVIPALIRKFHEAKLAAAPEVTAWGTGRPVRDFIYVEDACDAIAIAAEEYSGADIVNISSGRQVSIRELTETVARVVGFEGNVTWDTSKPDGQMLKGFDVTRMRDWLHYECRTTLAEGLSKTFAWFRANIGTARLSAAMHD